MDRDLAPKAGPGRAMGAGKEGLNDFLNELLRIDKSGFHELASMVARPDCCKEVSLLLPSLARLVLAALKSDLMPLLALRDDTLAIPFR